MIYTYLDYNDYTSVEFETIFREYYKEEGIVLKEDTKVFQEIEKSYKNGVTKTIVAKKEDNLVGFMIFRVKELKDENGFLIQKL